MSLISLVLLVFVILGLARDRLGRSAEVIMVLVVASYVIYAYSHPQ